MHQECPKQGQPENMHMHPERAHLEQNLTSQTPSNAKLGSGLQAAFLSYSSWVLRAIRMKIFLFCFCITEQFSLLKEGSTCDKLGKRQRSRLQASQALPCLWKQQAACSPPVQTQTAGKGAWLLCTELLGSI